MTATLSGRGLMRLACTLCPRKSVNEQIVVLQLSKYLLKVKAMLCRRPASHQQIV
jgi:hypothetical protein